MILKNRFVFSLLLLLLSCAASAQAQTKAVVKNINGNGLTENLVVPSSRSITINSGASIINNGTATGFGGAWGSITGTLSDQTDLQAALDAKWAKTATVVSGSLTLTAGTNYIVRPTSTYTLTLPASPANGDAIVLFQSAEAWIGVTITIARNGQFINGVAADVAYSSPGFGDGFVLCTYTTATGWRVMRVKDEAQLDAKYAALLHTHAITSLTSSNANRLYGSGAVAAGQEITVSTPLNLASGALTIPDGAISNAKLANSSITINGSAVSLGGSVTAVASITGTANEITVTGTTTPTLSLPSALTFTGKTVTGGTYASPILTTPRLANGGYLADANGNEVLILTTTASAVNEITLANAATGSNPTITASGGDTNIGVIHAMKGTGAFTVKAGTAGYNVLQIWADPSGVTQAYMRQDGMLHLGTYGLETPGIYNTGGGLCANTTTYGGTVGLQVYSLQVSSQFGFIDAQSLSGAGAVSVATTVTKYTSTGGAQALTLADGVDGQVKIVVHAVDGGSGVLTPTTKTGFTSLTFTNAGDTATLEFFTTIGWVILATQGTTITP